MGDGDEQGARRPVGDGRGPQQPRVPRPGRALLVTEAGLRQFLDIGTGIPTANNTHEVAQRAEPSARVVYVDNDPIVLIHARALLASHPAGATDYIDADLRDVGTILAAGLDLVEPGLVSTPQWRPGSGARPKPLPGWVGVAVKPAAGRSRGRADRRNTA